MATILPFQSPIEKVVTIDKENKTVMMEKLVILLGADDYPIDDPHVSIQLMFFLHNDVMWACVRSSMFPDAEMVVCSRSQLSSLTNECDGSCSMADFSIFGEALGLTPRGFATLILNNLEKKVPLIPNAPDQTTD
ncbi:MAG: hypothetical protein ABIH21_03850 [Patescibacteria group bacterium]